MSTKIAGDINSLPPKIYLAGKVDKNDWRHDIVDGLSDLCNNNFYNNPDQEWPIIEDAFIPGYSYSGPYFIGCDHGCSHGENTHGYGPGCGGSDFYDEVKCRGDGQRRSHIATQCKKAITRSDYIFAWIDDLTAFGTLFELGYASALNKRIFLALDESSSFWGNGPDKTSELWFMTYAISNNKDCRAGFFGKTPHDAFDIFLGYVKHIETEDCRISLIESPIELQFYKAMKELGITLEPQYDFISEDGRNYRADFADSVKKIVFELDGHDYHKTKEQRTNDARRERDFQKMGWTVIRFTGTEIYTDCQKCAKDAFRLMGETA
jgi:hypothetical protein